LDIPVEQVPAVAEPPKPAVVEPNKPAEPAKPAEAVPEPNQPAGPNETAEPNRPAQSVSRAANVQRAITWPSLDLLSGITCEQLTWAIRLVNAVLILTASLYCLTLLFSLKVSLHGRLGGINHISRAFFLSLLMLVLLLPWQKVFGGVVTGAIYTPAELIKWHAADKTDDVFHTVLYYLRFSGYGALILLLLVLSQYRSLRWAKAILRRLEII
jgi:hypothetical protein